MKKILGYLRRACTDFNLINEGDRVAAGLSGGKDSVALLYALARYREFSPIKFTLEAITVHMGDPTFNTEPLAELCSSLDVEYTVVPTHIQHVIFEERKEKNPCALCAKMRRGAMYEAAAARGINKVALGHHRDDLIDTFMLSLTYESRLYALAPSTYLSRSDLTMIRPLIYSPESELVSVTCRFNLPVVKNPCPVNGNTKRHEVKEMIQALAAYQPDMRERIFTALSTPESYYLWTKEDEDI